MTAASHWIAIVDDDASVLKALRRTLRVNSLLAKTFVSAQEFLGSLSAGLPDCLITDQQMPEMTGLELHQHLVRLGIQIPTIVITAHADIRLRERCESAGVHTFLLKPLRNDALIAAIAAAIQIRSDRG